MYELLGNPYKDNQQPSPTKGKVQRLIVYYIIIPHQLKKEMKKILKNRLNENGRNLLIATALGDGCINKQG